MKCCVGSDRWCGRQLPAVECMLLRMSAASEAQCAHGKLLYLIILLEKMSILGGSAHKLDQYLTDAYSSFAQMPVHPP